MYFVSRDQLSNKTKIHFNFDSQYLTAFNNIGYYKASIL